MSWFRQLAHACLRNRVFARRLPPEFGRRPIYVSADAALRYLRWSWHEAFADLFRLARELIEPGHQVWDIGANAGVFAVCAAHRSGPGGRCMAVEPDPVMVAMLERTLNHSANRDLRLAVLTAAVSDRRGESTLLIANGRASNTLQEAGARIRPEGFVSELPVPTLSLDDLLVGRPNPDLVKIDVEGAEVLIARGAQKMLSDARPLLFVETGRRQQKEMTAILKKHGYLFFRGSEEGYPSRDRCTRDTLAIPCEKVETMNKTSSEQR